MDKHTKDRLKKMSTIPDKHTEKHTPKLLDEHTNKVTFYKGCRLKFFLWKA